MTQKALRFALEALELVNIEFVCNGAHHAKKDRHELGDDCPVTARYQQAIAAIKEALAQRTWVGLTDDEQQDLYDRWVRTGDGWGLFYLLIEAKLEEKNT